MVEPPAPPRKPGPTNESEGESEPAFGVPPPSLWPVAVPWRMVLVLLVLDYLVGWGW